MFWSKPDTCTRRFLVSPFLRPSTCPRKTPHEKDLVVMGHRGYLVIPLCRRSVEGISDETPALVGRVVKGPYESRSPSWDEVEVLPFRFLSDREKKRVLGYFQSYGIQPEIIDN